MPATVNIAAAWYSSYSIALANDTAINI